MKSIESITNHIGFNRIFTACRGEDGKVDWRKVVEYRDLPDDLILKYFHQLHKFNLESKQKLPSAVLQKYQNYINWPLLLRTKGMNEEQAEEFFEVLKAKGMLSFLLAYAKYSMEFAERHAEAIVKVPNFRSHVLSNVNNGSTGEKIMIVLDRWMMDHPSE